MNGATHRHTTSEFLGQLLTYIHIICEIIPLKMFQKHQQHKYDQEVQFSELPEWRRGLAARALTRQLVSEGFTASSRVNRHHRRTRGKKTNFG